MPTTFTKISSVSVGAGGAASISFTSIPNTYTDLQINLSSRSNAASQDFANTYIAFNGSSANYTLTWLGIANASPVSYTQSAFGGANHLFYIPASTATSNTFGNSSIYLPNYAASNYKSLNADGANENNIAAIYEGVSIGLWSVTSAITSLAITTQGSFVQYSTATLYGIKKS